MRLALFIWLLLASIGFCGEYYVAPDGNNTNAGTIGAPWKTISKATGSPYVRVAGDTIYLREGRYTNSPLPSGHVIAIRGEDGAPSGTSNAPITIRSYPGETAVICDQPWGYIGANLANLAYYVFDGLVFSNTYQHFVAVNITNCVIKNCTFTTNGVQHGYGGVVIYGHSQFNTVSNCNFYSWGSISAGGEDDGCPFKLGAGDLDPENKTYYNLIISNRFIFGMHDNAEAESAYNVWRGNLFVNAPWYPTNSTKHILDGYNAAWDEENMYGKYGNRWLKPNDSTIGGKHDERNVYEYNTFLYAGPPCDDYGGGGFNLGNDASIVRFNTMAYSLHAGFALDGSGATSKSNTIYGNVMFANGLSWVYGGLGMQDYSGGFRSSTDTAKGTNWIVNNILWHNRNTNVATGAWQNQIVRTNWNQDFAGLANPLFVSTNGLGYAYNPANVPDFHLQTNSPAIDAGTWLASAVGSSNASTTLVVDNSLYFSDGNRIVQGDTIQLQGQTNRAIVLLNNWTNNVLTLDTALTWTNGQGVSLAYNGLAPDMGAFESGITSEETPPEPPVVTRGRATARRANVGTIR